MRPIEIDLPESLGGHIVSVEYASHWECEDHGNEPTHHVWEWVLHNVEIEGMFRYPETDDEEGEEMIPFSPDAEQLAYIEKELFDEVKGRGIK